MWRKESVLPRKPEGSNRFRNDAQTL